MARKPKIRWAAYTDDMFERTVKRLLATPPTPRKDMPKKRLGGESRPKGKRKKRQG